MLPIPPNGPFQFNLPTRQQAGNPSSSSSSLQNSIQQVTYRESSIPVISYVQINQHNYEIKLQIWQLLFWSNYNYYRGDQRFALEQFIDACNLNNKIRDRLTHYRITNHPLSLNLKNLQEIRDYAFEDYVSKVDPSEFMQLFFPKNLGGGMSVNVPLFCHECVFAFEILMRKEQDQDISFWVRCFQQGFDGLKRYNNFSSECANLCNVLSFLEGVLIREKPAYLQTLARIEKEGETTSKSKVQQLKTSPLTSQAASSINPSIPATPTSYPSNPSNSQLLMALNCFETRLLGSNSLQSAQNPSEMLPIGSEDLSKLTPHVFSSSSSQSTQSPLEMSPTNLGSPIPLQEVQDQLRMQGFTFPTISGHPLRLAPQGSTSGLNTGLFSLLNIPPNISNNVSLNALSSEIHQKESSSVQAQVTPNAFIKLPSISELLNPELFDPSTSSSSPRPSQSESHPIKGRAPKRRKKIKPTKPTLQENPVKETSQEAFTEADLRYQKLLRLGNHRFSEDALYPENMYNEIIESNAHPTIKLKAYNNLLVHAILHGNAKTISELFIKISGYAQSINIEESKRPEYLIFRCNSKTAEFFSLLMLSHRNVFNVENVKGCFQLLKKSKEEIRGLNGSNDAVSLINNNALILEAFFENTLSIGSFLDVGKPVNNPILRGILCNNEGVAARMNNLDANPMFSLAKQNLEKSSLNLLGLQKASEQNWRTSKKNFTLEQHEIEVEDMFMFIYFLKLQ